MIIKNKYGIEISQEMLINYFERLRNQFFKILPIYEGRDVETKKVIYSREESYTIYKKTIKNFIPQLCGGYYLFNNNEYFLRLLIILEALQQIDMNNHNEVKTLVFECINIIEKIKRGVANES